MTWAPNLVGTGHPHMGMSGCCPGFAAEHLSQGTFHVPGAGQTHAASAQEGWSPNGAMFPPGGRFRTPGPVPGTSGSLPAVGWQDLSSRAAEVALGEGSWLQA